MKNKNKVFAVGCGAFLFLVTVVTELGKDKDNMPTFSYEPDSVLGWMLANNAAE